MNPPECQSGAWLTPQAECLLKAANGRRRDVNPNCCLWQASGAIDGLDRELYPLLPNVYRALKTQGVTIPGMDRLKGMYRYTWSKNQRLVQQIAPLFQALGDSAIDAVTMGDMALALGYYRDLGRRPIFRVDILIRPDQAAAAVTLMEGIGWIMRAGAGQADGHRDTAGSFEHPSGVSCTLLTKPIGLRNDAIDEVWNAAVSLQSRSLRLRVPAPTDQLWEVCAQGALSGPGRSPLWLADALVILSGHEKEIDWNRIGSIGRTGETGASTDDALRYVRDTLRAPIPHSRLSKQSFA